MVHCTVFGCYNRSEKKSGVSFHRFPTNHTRQKQWVTAIGRPYFLPGKYSAVCSAHFPRSQFMDYRIIQRRTLKRDAVPLYGPIKEAKEFVELELGAEILVASRPEQKSDLGPLCPIPKKESDSDKQVDHTYSLPSSSKVFQDLCSSHSKSDDLAAELATVKEERQALQKKLQGQSTLASYYRRKYTKTKYLLRRQTAMLRAQKEIGGSGLEQNTEWKSQLNLVKDEPSFSCYTEDSAEHSSTNPILVKEEPSLIGYTEDCSEHDSSSPTFVKEEPSFIG